MQECIITRIFAEIPGNAISKGSRAGVYHDTCWVHQKLVCRVAQSVKRLATVWTVQGSNPRGGENFRTSPDRPWGPPRLLLQGYRIIPEGKAAGALC